MAKVRLTWKDRKLVEDGVNIYRGTAPIDPGALPAPLASVPVGREVYEDKTVTAGTTYHYHVAPFDGSEVGAGAADSVAAAEEVPRFLYATEPRHLPDTLSATISVQVPACRAGDLLVAVGFRRAAWSSTPSGWTDAGSPASQVIAGVDQHSFAFWKIAAGTESGQTITFTQAANGRMGLQILVFRHDSKPIVCSSLALQRAPTGSVDATPLTVTNGTTPALLLVTYSWVRQVADDSLQRQHSYSSRAWPPFWPEWYASHPRLSSQRFNTFLTEAAANEAVSISFTSSVVNSDESRSSVWLAIRT